MITDKELIALEKKRQNESDWVLKKIDLIAKLKKYGEVNVVGAKALGLMVAKDIDISVLVDKVKMDDWTKLVGELLVTPYVRRVNAIDYYNYDSNNKYDPKNGQKYSLYISIEKFVGPDEDRLDPWEIQIHLQTKDVFDEKKVEEIKNKLTPDLKLVIFRLKYWAHEINKILKIKSDGNFKINSTHIYNSVLDKKINTVDGFIKHFIDLAPEEYKELFMENIKEIG